ncbi:hypothetical protein [Kitasatospora cheerisanensis]|uniref:Uncharacterized protein n=1 Tax=Kitasatospora cheerisanensis KCTC 2395 TaxID=1348663 RepID=A0A066Z5X5_9ACTN|nr:hypothetical protein [Kitasatospora cheerisanensis]KDN85706.1 hypothetical protein KCH_25340 [Kitasatospora cheerisanensis KCTC 2395]
MSSTNNDTPSAKGPIPLVIGLDLSLASTGIAGVDWADALRPKGTLRGHPRLAWIVNEITDRVRRADMVVIEGAAYGHGAQAGHHELAGLWWMVTQALWHRSIPYAVVTPSQLKVYACGTANPAADYPKETRSKVAKGMVRDAVAQLFGLDCEGSGRYDKADAAVLAHMGRDWLGHPTVSLPERHRRALTAVPWPEPARKRHGWPTPVPPAEIAAEIAGPRA